MTAAPHKHKAAPSQSLVLGSTPSATRSQNKAVTMYTPPYAA